MESATTSVQPEDVLPVNSRVSWGSIFAGAAVALAVYFLFTVLGTAMGLSVTNAVGEQTLGTMAAIYAVLVLLFSFFLGGFVTTQVAVGENRPEAMIHGVVLWAVLFGALLWLAANGIRMGFNAMMVASTNPSVRAAIEEQLRQPGMTAEQLRQKMTEIANDPETMRNVTAGSWWTFAGIIVSMLAAVWGALAGCGPKLIFRNLVRRTTYVRGGTFPSPG
jgi:hypothetical protein